MDSPADIPPCDGEQEAAARIDLTGRDRMARNVLASWAGHIVFIVAGFVLPRVMDRHLGQVALGVWDFCWSVVGYFGLVSGGIGSSVDRYVAQFRATGDTEGLRCAMASVNCVLLVAGTLITALAVAISSFLPLLVGDRLGDFEADAQWLVLFLGAALALRVSLTAYGGVIRGCHRWGLHSAIDAGFYTVIIVGMIAALLLGKSLPALALIYFCGVVITEVTRAAIAYRVCPELSVHLKFVRWSAACRMITFGSKTFVPRIAEVLLNQTISILILAHLGPAVLALYARPRALVRHVRTLVGKFAFTLTPIASSLSAMQKQEETRGLLIMSTKYAACISIPLTLALVILGDSFLRIWMGPQYASGFLLAALAAGFFATVTHQTAVSILIGLNAHGRPGIARLVGAICAASLTALALGPLQWGLLGAAVAIGLPLTIVDGIYIPAYACRRLGVPFGTYLLHTYRRPVACAIPFAVCLVLGRLVFADHPVAGVLSGVSTGTLVLSLAYWKYVLPEHWRTKTTGRVTGVVSRVAWAQARTKETTDGRYVD